MHTAFDRAAAPASAVRALKTPSSLGPHGPQPIPAGARREADPAGATSLTAQFANDVLDGLARRRRTLPCRWRYDERGAQLFELAQAQPEYYPVQAEAAILRQAGEAIALAAGAQTTVIELGSGGGLTTPLLLGALDRPAACVTAEPSAATLPPAQGEGRRVLFFAGCAIGRFEPDAAEALLQRWAQAAGAGALLVIGVDHTRDPRLLVPAYDDRAGVTAACNLNLLERINRELQGTFDPAGFRHLAAFDAAEQRMEVHLVSRRVQRASVLGRDFDFAAGELVHTESAHKPSPFRFVAMAHRTGWKQKQLWVDGRSRYAVHVLQVAPWA